MMKKLECGCHPHVVGPALDKLDRNKSGYLEFDDFKLFVAKDPYPIWSIKQNKFTNSMKSLFFFF